MKGDDKCSALQECGPQIKLGSLVAGLGDGGGAVTTTCRHHSTAFR